MMSERVPKKDAQKPFWIKAIKKPVVVQFREVIPTNKPLGGGEPFETVNTGHGLATAYPSKDFIIKDECGEYPIRKDIFVKTYKLITSEQEAQLK